MDQCVDAPGGAKASVVAVAVGQAAAAVLRHDDYQGTEEEEEEEEDQEVLVLHEVEDGDEVVEER